jgi:hypothetical protein
VFLDQLACRLEFKAYLDCLQCGAKCLCAHELGAFGENDVEVAVQHGSNVVLLEILAKIVVLKGCGVLVVI